MDLTPENIQRLLNWVNNEFRFQDSTGYISSKICNYLNTDLLMRCPACLDIPCFSLIFLCGQVECYNCYLCYFKFRARRRRGIFFTIYPVCRTDVSINVVLIALHKI